METHVTGPPVLGELRQHALTALLGHPLFSAAEQRRATQFAYACEDVARLTRWATSIRAEITRREVDAARQRGYRATHEVLRHLRPTPFRGHGSRPPHPAPSWVPGAPLPDRTDHRAGTFDRLAAARFLPADSLMFVSLLRRPAR